MKKIIFLLLMAVFLAGVVFANDAPVHPPGVLNLEAALFGDSADNFAVIPDTVPEVALSETAELSGFQVVGLYDESATQTQISGTIIISNLPAIFGQAQVVSGVDDFYLRL